MQLMLSFKPYKENLQCLMRRSIWPVIITFASYVYSLHLGGLQHHILILTLFN